MKSKFIEILPGMAITVIIACTSRFIENLLQIHLIGASVIALFIGMLINYYCKFDILKPGIMFTSKRLLKFAIVLLGASLSIKIVLDIGKLSLTVMVFTLLTCFGGGHIIGKLLKLNWKLSNLISAGTGICGGSAIAAIAPVIEANDNDIAYAISATFLFDIVMIIIFPIIGQMLGMSDMAYGLWTGTAVNDTSSVVAAGYAYSEAAGDFATMVKLTRTLTIVPVVLIFSIINAKIKQKEISSNSHTKIKRKKVRITSIFPWFILGFIALTILNSIGLLPKEVSLLAKNSSKFLMIASLAAIGLNTNLTEMKKSGIAPMIHGFVISTLVVVVAITVEYFMGII